MSRITNPGGPTRICNPSEIQIQASAFQYLYNNYPELRGQSGGVGRVASRGLLFHVPNGGNRNAIEGMQLKASGVVAGVPDLILIWSGWAYWIEVKTQTGVISDVQREVQGVLEQAGCKGIIARSAEEIISFVEGVMKGECEQAGCRQAL